MHKREMNHRIGPGASTVLLILLVMCLTLLGVLSMAQARNDLAITQRALAAEQTYYLARIQAEAALAELDACIAGGGVDKLPGFDAVANAVTLEIPVDEHRQIRMVAALSQERNSFELIENRIIIIPEEIEIW